jgi:hypothetical protein
MADASANPRAIAVGFCRHPEREHASDLFAAPATELRGAAATVDPWGGTVHPPLRLLVCGVLLGFVTLRQRQRPLEPLLFLLLHAPVTGGGA